MFVQAGDENVHLVRSVMDDVFGRKNFRTIITIANTAGATSDLMVVSRTTWFGRKRQRSGSNTVSYTATKEMERVTLNIAIS
jgi:adenine-specific DNA-methyltransferase